MPRNIVQIALSSVRKVLYMINDGTGIRGEVERLLSRYLSDGKFNELWNGDKVEVVDDGILDEPTWKQLGKSKRILWLLKEHNEHAPIYGDAAVNGADKNRMRLFGDMFHDGHGSVASNVGVQFKRNANWFRTLKLIELASHAILASEIPSNISHSVRDRAIDTYCKLCVVEVGKTPGGKRTPDKRLRLLCEAWGDIVRRQIEKYDPGIVISTGPQLEYLYSEDERGDVSRTNLNSSYVDRYSFDGRIWLRTFHPGYPRVNRLDWVCAIAQAILAGHEEK